MTILAFCLGCSFARAGEVFCFFERYLVAKIRTILLLLTIGVFLTSVIEVVSHFTWFVFD
jgi:hypothetical protein